MDPQTLNTLMTVGGGAVLYALGWLHKHFLSPPPVPVAQPVTPAPAADRKHAALAAFEQAAEGALLQAAQAFLAHGALAQLPAPVASSVAVGAAGVQAPAAK